MRQDYNINIYSITSINHDGLYAYKVNELNNY